MTSAQRPPRSDPAGLVAQAARRHTLLTRPRSASGDHVCTSDTASTLNTPAEAPQATKAAQERTGGPASAITALDTAPSGIEATSARDTPSRRPTGPADRLPAITPAAPAARTSA